VLVIEHVIRPPGLPASDQLAAHDNAAPGKTHLAADLGGFIPASLDNGGRDALGADIGFAHVSLMHGRIIPGAAAEMPVSRNTKVLCAPASMGAHIAVGRAGCAASAVGKAWPPVEGIGEGAAGVGTKCRLCFLLCCRCCQALWRVFFSLSVWPVHHAAPIGLTTPFRVGTHRLQFSSFLA
jgi:hypothetical protein